MDNTLEATIQVQTKGVEEAKRKLKQVKAAAKQASENVEAKVSSSGSSGMSIGKIMAGVLGIRTLYNLIRQIAGNNENISTAVSQLLGTVANALKPVLDTIAGVIAIISDFIGQIFGVTSSTSTSTKKMAKSLASIDEITNLSSSSSSSTSADLTYAKSLGKKLLETIVYAITAALGLLVDSIGGIFADIAGVIWGVFKGLYEWITGGSFIKGFKDGFASVYNYFHDKVQVPIENTLTYLYANYLKKPLQLLLNGLGKIVNGFISMVNSVITTINKIPGVNLSKMSTWQVPTLANGGFVQSGQMFIANEAGPELVGRIGNNTAVANNDQIIEGIKRGVIEAMRSGSFNANVYLDGKQITDSVVKNINKQSRIMGGSIV